MKYSGPFNAAAVILRCVHIHIQILLNMHAYSHPNVKTRDNRPTACSLPITMANFAMSHTTPTQDRRAACVVYRDGGGASSGGTGAGALLSRLRVLQGHAAGSTVVVVRCGCLRAVVWLGRVGAHGRCEGGGTRVEGLHQLRCLPRHHRSIANAPSLAHPSTEAPDRGSNGKEGPAERTLRRINAGSYTHCTDRRRVWSLPSLLDSPGHVVSGKFRMTCTVTVLRRPPTPPLATLANLVQRTLLLRVR